MIGIVIVDDHPSIRDGLGTRIALEPDLEVCGEADDVESALDLIKKVQPDVAVIDVSLRTGNGIERYSSAQRCRLDWLTESP